MSSRRRALATIAGVTLALGAACSGDDDADTSPGAQPTAVTQVEGDVAPPTEPTTTDSPATTDSPITTASPTTEPEPEPEPEPASGPPRLSGLPAIELSTPHDGAGDRPLLEWSPAEGADLYGVYLYGPDESIYWTWQGYETSVFVGGATQLPDSMPGPSVADGMTWSVVGFDADFLPVAASDVRPIAP